MSNRDQGMERIGRLAREAERRIRFGFALGASAAALCVALCVAIVTVALGKVGVLGEGQARAVLGAAGAGVLLAAVLGWARRLPEGAGARALDRFHNLSDRFASALAFASLPRPARTPFMVAAMEDAVAMAGSARPRLAVPIRAPPTLAAAAGLTALLAAVMVFEVRRHAPILAQSPIRPIDMSADDIDEVEDFLKQIDQSLTSDDTKAAVLQFNKLIDDIASKRLDRTEAFRRMQALEDKLSAGARADKKALDDEVERIGEELRKAELTKPVGDALIEQKLDRARGAMHELSKKMRAGVDKPFDKAKLDQMRAALKKAAANVEARRREIDQRRQELADEILRLKQKTGDGGSDEERSLLEKKQRELDRLDRDLDARSDAARTLDRLDRELEQAAEDLMKDLGLTAEDLDRGAEDINRMDQEERTQQEKEQLRQKVEELRELLREQDQGGKPRVVRLKRFGKMARGHGGSQDQSGDKQGGDPGEGQGEPQGGEGQLGRGDEQGRDGQGQGGSAGGGSETWVLGPSGEKILMLSAGRAAQGGGVGRAGTGRQAGTGHDPKVEGAATNPPMGTQDTQVQGADSARGGSRSQIILGAGERGFASRGYKRVYAEYHQVAEETLAKDEIPGGFRFYVKRYFQLIRPREQ
jgi:hypothetical protein